MQVTFLFPREGGVQKNGEIIFFEGFKSDELYVFADGIVDILVNPDLVSDNSVENHFPVKIATLRRGQSFGEIALVDQGDRSASAKTMRDNTLLLIIPRNKLISLCDEHSDLGYQLMLNLAADLAPKIRSTGLLIREELLYRSA